jgi:hypothetical protein
MRLRMAQRYADVRLHIQESAGGTRRRHDASRVSTWIGFGLTDGCADPDEVMSLFAPGFDSPISALAPDYSEAAAD